MLKIGSVRWRGKCSKHPGYDPYIDGPGAIKGGCERCLALAEIHSHHSKMLAMMKRFAPQPSAKKRANDTLDLQENLFGDFLS
jgi:hypothetical protein